MADEFDEALVALDAQLDTAEQNALEDEGVEPEPEATDDELYTPEVGRRTLELANEAKAAGIDLSDTEAVNAFAEQREVDRLKEEIQARQEELAEPWIDSMVDAEADLLENLDEAMEGDDPNAIWDVYREAQANGVDTSEALLQITAHDPGLAHVLVQTFGAPKVREIDYDNVAPLVEQAQAQLEHEELRSAVQEQLNEFGQSEHALEVARLTREALASRDEDGNPLFSMPKNAEEARETVVQIGKVYDRHLREESAVRTDPFIGHLAQMDIRTMQSADETPDAPNSEAELLEQLREVAVGQQLDAALPGIIRSANVQPGDSERAFLEMFDRGADRHPGVSGKDEYEGHVKEHRAAQSRVAKSEARGRLEAHQLSRSRGLDGLPAAEVARLKRLIEGE